MTAIELLKILRKNIVLIVVLGILGIVFGTGFFVLKKPSYTARSTVYVTIDLSDSDNKNAVGTINSASSLALQKSKSYLSLFSDKSTALSVKEKLGLSDSVSSIAASIAASNTKDSPSIQISASSTNKEQAQLVADTVAQVVGERVSELEGKNSPIHLNMLSSAKLTEPTRTPTPQKILLLSVAIALVLALTISIVKEQFDFKLRRPEQLSAITTKPILARIPLSDKISAGELLDSEAFEHVRKIRTALNYVSVDHGVRAVLFTSSQDGEGKSSVVAAFARVAALSGKEVLVVDCDIRCAALSERFGFGNHPGLTHVLAGSIAIEDAIMPINDVNGLYILPSGDSVPNPSELLSSQRMVDLLDQLRDDYFVVIDSPPVLPVTDAVVLSGLSDAVVIVVGMGIASGEDVLRTIETLDTTSSNIAGLVANKLDPKLVRNAEYTSKYVKGVSN